MTLRDDDFATLLRRRLDVPPAMSLDVARAVRDGRRRRVRLQTVTAGSAAALVAGVAFLPAVLHGTPPPPAPVAASPAAPADVVRLAPALRATRAPVARTYPDGSTWWDTGLGADGTSLAFADENSWWGTQRDIELAVVTPDGDPVSAGSFAWDDEADVRDHGPTTGYDSAVSTSLGAPGTAVAVSVGATPAWLPGARVALVLSYGVPDSSGRLRHVYEIPTFADPAGSGASLHAIGADESALDMTGGVPRDGTVPGMAWIVYVGADGSSYVNGLPVTRHQLAMWVPQAPVDEVVEELRALGAEL